ncbi:MAG TPA: hypothetical protein PLE54_00445 [Burkholderiaceae bacterium]|jgi:hypothetical protein|nr:hypothetical protein [Burkholderiaceae bacterium]HQR69044.1 hypothetical protein [Burkholderiaceae bacterium]
MSLPAKVAFSGLSQAAAALLLGAVVPSSMAVTAAPPPQSVIVRADRYGFDDWSTRDLEALAATVRATRPSFVELYACGAEANRVLLVAAQRLSDLPLQLLAYPDNAPACTSAAQAAPASQPLGADDAAAVRYWQQVMP